MTYFRDRARYYLIEKIKYFILGILAYLSIITIFAAPSIGSDGKFGDYFSYLKELAYYQIQVSINNNGAIRVLAILCIITAIAFFFRNIFRYLGAFLLVNYRVGVTKDLRTNVYHKFLKLPVWNRKYLLDIV